MISRRKFLRAGALFLPAAAIGQVVPNRKLFVYPGNSYGLASANMNNFSAVDLLRFGVWGGSGWNGPAVLSNTPTYENRVIGDGAGNSGSSVLAYVGSTGSTFQWGRKPTFGANWTQLRIAWLTSVDCTAASFAGGNLLCGVTNNYKDWGVSSSNFVGYMAGGGAAWSRISNSGHDFYTSGTSDRYAVTNINGTFGNVSYGAGSPPDCYASNAFRRTINMVDITKGSPNYTVDSWSMESNGVNADYNEFWLNQLLGVAAATSLVIGSTTVQYGGSASIAFTETNPVDTIKFFGQATGANPVLYAVGIRKIS